MKTIWKVLIGIGVFFLLILMLAFCGTKGVADVAKDTLSAIKSDDYAKAYALTSSEFQKVTSLDDFRAFVAQYPILKNYSKFSISTQKVENLSGTVSGYLLDASQAQTPIDVGLVKENDEWKVLSIELGASNLTADNTASSSTSIYDILVNDTADAEGYVEIHKSTVSKNAPHIYATVQIEKAVAGMNATGLLILDETGEQIGPVDNPIEQNGDILKAFSFTNTGGQWPEGKYTIRITLSDGQSKEIKIEVQ